MVRRFLQRKVTTMVVTNIEDYIIELPEDASFEDYFGSEEVPPRFNEEFQDISDVVAAQEIPRPRNISVMENPNLQEASSEVELIELTEDDDNHEELLENLDLEQFSNFEFEAFSTEKDIEPSTSGQSVEPSTSSYQPKATSGHSGEPSTSGDQSTSGFGRLNRCFSETTKAYKRRQNTSSKNNRSKRRKRVINSSEVSDFSTSSESDSTVNTRTVKSKKPLQKARCIRKNKPIQDQSSDLSSTDSEDDQTKKASAPEQTTERPSSPFTGYSPTSPLFTGYSQVSDGEVIPEGEAFWEQPGYNQRNLSNTASPTRSSPRSMSRSSWASRSSSSSQSEHESEQQREKEEFDVIQIDSD